MEQTGNNPSKGLMALLTGACCISGWLAGANIDRYIVQLPAWKYVNIIDWAEYSRHADLGNGLWLYPLEAVGTFILLLAASIIAIKNRATLKKITVQICAAAFFAVLKIALSALSSPVIMRLKTSGNDRQLLQKAFDQYHFWSPYNGIVQLSCFFFCLVSLLQLTVIQSSLP